MMRNGRNCAIYFLFVITGLVLNVIEVESDRDDRVSKKIYESISHNYTCFLRLNGTHQAGCTSKEGGNVGVIHLINSDTSLNWVLKDGPHNPYIALIYPNQFKRDVLIRFKSSQRVNGILLMKENATRASNYSFSPDQTCPNQGYGYDDKSDCQNWNPAGNGLIYEDWGFPIFYIDVDEDIIKLLECFNKFNSPNSDGDRNWPLCAAELQSFMQASVDTPTCIRRGNYVSLNPSPRLCDPLGGWNIWSTLYSRNQSTPYHKNEASVIVVAARLDSSSMFDDLSPGADSTASGIATLLAMIKHLGSVKDQLKKSPIENVYFVLFNGEAFDYIGSSRLVYDMVKGQFPTKDIANKSDSLPAILNMKNIKYFIEINQVGLGANSREYFVHQNWNGNESGRIVSVLKTEGIKVGLDINTSSISKIPPASFQSFLKVNSTLPGVIVTNFDHQFENRFYNSIFDNDANIGYSYANGSVIPLNSVTNRIAMLASTLARTVVNLMGGNSSTIQPDNKIVDELLNCYLVTPYCQIFKMIAPNTTYKKPNPFPLYSGIHNSYTMNHLSFMTWSIMGFFQGKKVPLSNEECIKIKDNDQKFLKTHFWINESCFESTASATDALSPAFVESNYDFKSRVYSTWTESVWKSFSVRIFIKPSLAHELSILFSGIFVLLSSFFAVGWFTSNVRIAFDSRDDLPSC